MAYDPDIPFRWFPRLFWKRITPHARKAVGFGPYEQWEMLCFGWFLTEIDIGVFRQPA